MLHRSGSEMKLLDFEDVLESSLGGSCRFSNVVLT